MKISKLFALLVAVSIAVIACKKESGETLTPIYQPDAYLPEDASGALYAVKALTIRKDSTGKLDSTKLSIARGWFGNMTNTKTSGFVIANGDTLATKALGGDPYTATWYANKDINNLNFFGFSSAVNWKVKADSASGIPAITYYDQNSFPSITNLSIPDSVRINATLTVGYKFANQATGDQLLIQAKGSLGKTGWATSITGTSEKFTAMDLAAIAKPGDSLRITLIPVKINKSDFEGKSYYFIKEAPVTRLVRVLN